MSLRAFRRDLGRIGRVRKSWIIVAGVLITPALYAWFNINAFWDPYAATGNIPVAVVNLDQGADTELTGPLDVGSQVIEQLQDNDQLGWEFMSEAEAQDAVQRGKAFAAIVIPADFSHDLLSLTSGTFTQPQLRYYVNEKSNAIAPKITDVGASELDRQITEAFTTEVATAATEALRDAGVDVEGRIDDTKDRTLNAIDTAAAQVGDARASLANIGTGLDSARASVGQARQTLNDVDSTLGEVQTALTQAQRLVQSAQQQVLSFTDTATSAYVQSATALAQAAAGANTSVTALTNGFTSATGRIDSAIGELERVTEANAAVIAQLQALVDGGTLPSNVQQQVQSVITSLQQRNQADQQLLSDLQAANAQAASAAQAVKASSDAVAAASKNAQNAATALQGSLATTLPALNSAMLALTQSSAAFQGSINAQRATLTQAGTLLNNLDAQLVATKGALASLDGNLGGVQDGIATARVDLLALGSASDLNTISTLTGLDPASIAAFVAVPVEITQTAVFPIDSYGSAMAALFTNLSLWIGAFVLMVIFKIEVDTEGVEGISVRQAYMGRFMLFASLAIGQALIVCFGNLVIGIQTASAAAYVVTGVLTAIAYVSIVYALCVSFGHIGRGLCILLVIMQIPGASGLYPIEMMPGFFRAIYPFLPFTYGINAMRETIAGFYGAHYWGYMGVLAIFVALAFVLGLVLRRRLANLNLVFNREIAATDLLIAEDVQVTGHGYRLTDLIHALSDRGEYQEDLERRAKPFTSHYPAIVRAAMLGGLGGLIVLGVIAWLLPGGKASLLGIWVVWVLLIMGTLVAIEYVKQSFELAGELGTLEDEELRREMLRDGPRRRTGPALAMAGAAGGVDTLVLPAEADGVVDDDLAHEEPVHEEPVHEEPGTSELEQLFAGGGGGADADAAEAPASEPTPEPPVDDVAASEEVQADEAAPAEEPAADTEVLPTDEGEHRA